MHLAQVQALRLEAFDLRNTRPSPGLSKCDIITWEQLACCVFCRAHR